MRFTNILFLAPLVAGHSWIERATKIEGGKLNDDIFGYARGKIPRSDGWSDTDSVWQLPGKDNMCQWGSGDTQGQKLSVAAGDQIALRYLENGHVTMPDVPPGHPTRSGVIFIYATDKAADDDQFTDIHRVWNAAGTGGDGRGRLIATRFYDDGQCYESNASDISKERQAEYPKDADSLMGAHVWCQSDVTIPDDMSGTVSLYWVWDWPILADPTQMPYNWEGDGVSNAQTYTSCIDIDVSAKSKRDVEAPVEKRAMEKNAINTAIVQEQQDNAYLADFGDLTKAAAAPKEDPVSTAPEAAPETTSKAAPKETQKQEPSSAPEAPATTAPAPAPTTSAPKAPETTAAAPTTSSKAPKNPVENADSPGTVTVTAPAVTVTAPGQGGATVTVSAPAVTVTMPSSGDNNGNQDNGSGDNNNNGSDRPTITRTATTMSTVVVKPSQAPASSPAEAPATTAPAEAPATTAPAEKPAASEPVAANPVDPNAVPTPTSFIKRSLSGRRA